VGWATVTLVSDRVVDFLVVAGTVAVAAVLIVYASLATWRTLKSGARPQPIPAVPADAFSSWNASDGHDGVDPWKASVVRDRIEAAYADFLERPDASVSARRTMPVMVQVAPSGEFVATRRASLL
jgi:hypothetical protein